MNKAYSYYKGISLDPNVRKYSVLYITNIDNNKRGTTSSGNTTESIIRGSNIDSYRSTVIYKGSKLETVVHELGHDLKLRHTFRKGILQEVKKHKTPDNYMDYITPGSTDNRNRFYRYHIKQTN